MWMADPIRVGHVARENEMVPRGPGMGSHVAPSQHFIWKVPNFFGLMGFEPMTTHQAQVLSQMTQHQCTHVLLVKSNVFKCI